MQTPSLESLFKHYLFVLFFACVSLFGLYKVSGFGAASLDYYFVKNIVGAWQQDVSGSPEADYQRAKSAMADARQSHPMHPLYVDLSAQIYEWGALAQYEPEVFSLQAAKAYYRKAIVMRPTWPVTYASLAFVKWRLNEFDDELLSLMVKADSFGPKKAEVNVLFAEMGLALYTSNHPFYRKIYPYVLPKIKQGLRNGQSRARVLQAINAYQAKPTVCRWLKEDDLYVSKTLLKC